MEFWQGLVIAAIPSVAAVATAMLGFRDLGMRRRLETSKQFLTLFATAHSRPTDGRDGVGVGEQVATLHLIADFARREPLVRNAAVQGLRHFAEWDKGGEASMEEILPPLLASMPEQKATEAAVQVVAVHRTRKSGQQEVAIAAREALKRLE